MKITATDFPGLLVIDPKIFSDDRGYFFESYRKEHFKNAGFDLEFKQDNQSKSTRGVLRGLHYQLKYGQGKLVSCAQGEIYDVALDIRIGSPTFSQSFTKTLNDTDHQAIYIPPGFAHGFCTLVDNCDVLYKVDNFYSSEHEGGIIWDDSKLNISWPTKDPIISPKDKKLVGFDEFVAKYEGLQKLGNYS